MGSRPLRQCHQVGVADDRAAGAPSALGLLVHQHPHPQRVVLGESGGVEHRLRRVEAVRYADAAVARILRKELDAGPVAGLHAFLALWRGIVLASDFRAGCPVLAVAVEEPPADETPPALVAATEAFDRWEELLAEALREHGAAPDRAPGLATLIVASVEGAIAMCRAKRSMKPLDQVAQQLEALIVSALDRSA
ncbi:TetR family transcriptional regulator C-terminal domain-containing protein [Streptomyces sp. NPDC060065]|uniref:LmrA/YxaF family transcription factor n=1 Tax=Streptomyces sp. NPDC060065 TaxID=3347050 RepID=UPI0036A2720A